MPVDRGMSALLAFGVVQAAALTGLAGGWQLEGSLSCRDVQ